MHLLIIGGSDAGISAALRAKEIDRDAEVTVVVADSFPNYSICGLPFYVSGEVPDWRRLAHRTAEEIEREGIRLLLHHTATAIDPAAKTVKVVDAGGQARALSYDRLVIGTGAAPMPFEAVGVDLPGVYPLHTMEDSFRVHHHVAEMDPQTAVIVGAGYIGLEMADAFRHRGLQVTLIVRSQVLRATIDAGLARVVEDELRRRGIEVVKQVNLESIQRDGSRLLIAGSNGFRRNADLVLMAGGRAPVQRAGRERGRSDRSARRHPRRSHHGDQHSQRLCGRRLRRDVAPRDPAEHVPAAGNDGAQARARRRRKRGRRAPPVCRFAGHASRQGIRPRRRSHGTARRGSP